MKNLFTLVLIWTTSMAFAQNIAKYSPKELQKWQAVGMGNAVVTHGQLLMEETADSKGFMLVSPDSYKDVVLRYEVMTLNPATVLVALLNASDIGSSTELSLPEGSDRFGFWTKEVEDYMFAFRVQAHNSTPFLRKHPQRDGVDTQIGLADKDVMHSGWRHTVECGRKGERLWLKIDNEIIIDTQDKDALGAGKIAVRVRGTASELGKCMIRNLEIEGEPIK